MWARLERATHCEMYPYELDQGADIDITIRVQIDFDQSLIGSSGVKLSRIAMVDSISLQHCRSLAEFEFRRICISMKVFALARKHRSESERRHSNCGTCSLCRRLPASGRTGLNPGLRSTIICCHSYLNDSSRPGNQVSRSLYRQSFRPAFSDKAANASVETIL
jgi:hypothetical protein